VRVIPSIEWGFLIEESFHIAAKMMKKSRCMIELWIMNTRKFNVEENQINSLHPPFNQTTHSKLSIPSALHTVLLWYFAATAHILFKYYVLHTK
jgi:hypothetical protein